MKQIMNMSQHKTEIEEHKGKTVLKFEAMWCSPCKAITHSLNDLEKQYGGVYNFAKVDVEASPDVAQYYSVMNLPTVLMLDHGQVFDSFVGFKPKADIEDMLKKHL